MATFIHSFSSRHILCIESDKFSSVGELKEHLASEKGVEAKSCFLVCNGHIVEDSEPVKRDVVYHTYLRLPGGKGGFGSMLRAIGAQIEKTTNHEACRDLSGRRMRDVNNEKELKEWLGKQAERERERELKRQERIARRRAMPNHKFSDPLYDEQKALLAEQQEDALQTGLKKAFTKPGTSSSIEEPGTSKRKVETTGASFSGVSSSKKKKTTEWLGMDIDNLSDLDSDDGSDSDNKPSNSEDMNTNSEDSNSGLNPDSAMIYKIKLENDDDSCRPQADSSVPDIVKTEPGSSESLTDKTVADGESSGQSSDNSNDKNEATKVENIGEESSKVQCESDDSADAAQDTKPFILDNMTSVEDVEKLGLDRLKQELMDRGLKCGGTLEQRAERLYSVKGLTKDQIDPSLFAKSSNGKKVKNKK